MSDTTGERSCYTLSTARDEVVRTDRNGGSIFRELPRILPPPLSPRLLSRKHHAVEFFRLRLADICEHSRWPEPPHPEEQYPDRRCSRDYSCKRRMYFGCPRPGYVQNSQSRPKGTDYLINAGNRPILHVRAGKDTECGSPDFVTDFRNTTGSSPRGGCCLL